MLAVPQWALWLWRAGAGLCLLGSVWRRLPPGVASTGQLGKLSCGHAMLAWVMFWCWGACAAASGGAGTIIHPASRGVPAHTAGLFRSVRGAKGGVEYEEQSSTGELTYITAGFVNIFLIFTFPPRGAFPS